MEREFAHAALIASRPLNADERSVMLLAYVGAKGGKKKRRRAMRRAFYDLRAEVAASLPECWDGDPEQARQDSDHRSDGDL